MVLKVITYTIIESSYSYDVVIISFMIACR